MNFFDASTIAPVQETVSSPWSVQANKPDFADNEELKQLFAIELAKGSQPFDAALVALKDTGKALWATIHWIKDVQVIAWKDAYTAAQKAVEKPLDKDELLAEILAFAKQTDSYGRPLVDAKERLNALRLYSDIRGFTGNKIELNNNSNNTFNNKTVNLVLVKAGEEKQQPKTIDNQLQSPNHKSQIINQNEASPIKLKLVGGAG